MGRQKIFSGELVGEEIMVTEAKNSLNKGIEGIVIDETKATIKVEKQGKIVTLLKNEITFKIKSTGEEIRGATITRKPEDRLKG